MVTITAPAEQDGKPFARWKVEAGDITLAEETARQTTFVMGSLDVEVTACYDTKDSPTPAPGGDGDGGGAGISVGAILGRHDGFNEEVKVENCTVSGKTGIDPYQPQISKMPACAAGICVSCGWDLKVSKL